LVSSRSKRWNGNFDALPVQYLQGVMAKMADYGDRVQFSLVSGGPEPSYQIINSFDKRMAFDKNHHLFRPEQDEFTGSNASAVFTLDQVKAVINGVRIKPAPARSARVVRPSTGGVRTVPVRMEDQFAAQRYEYFKNNRESLPPTITEHSEEITQLMRKGMSAEEAFGAVVKKYF
jgi:hypothetical protein